MKQFIRLCPRCKQQLFKGEMFAYYHGKKMCQKCWKRIWHLQKKGNIVNKYIYWDFLNNDE